MGDEGFNLCGGGHGYRHGTLNTNHLWSLVSLCLITRVHRISLCFDRCGSVIVDQQGESKHYRQWTHVFKILREIDLLYEYYGHFHHVIDKTKNIGGTVPV